MSEPTPDLSLSQSTEAQQLDVDERSSANPDEFLSIAHDVSPTSADEPSGQPVDSLTQSATEQPENQEKAVEIPLSPLAELLGNLVKVWQENRTLLVALGLILVLLPLSTLLIGLTASLLAAIHSVPFLAPIFKLIGISYTIWFFSRYLLSQTTRQNISGLWQKLLTAAQS